MFDRRSRYHELPELHYTDERGNTLVYKARRLLSRDPHRPVLWEVEVNDGERPDLLAARTLRQPELFWRVCDANDVMQPFELTSRSGRRVRILMPGV